MKLAIATKHCSFTFFVATTQTSQMHITKRCGEGLGIVKLGSKK
jgi:hypothetical protein